jgi:hypothetical protein
MLQLAVIIEENGADGLLISDCWSFGYFTCKLRELISQQQLRDLRCGFSVYERGWHERRTKG